MRRCIFLSRLPHVLLGLPLMALAANVLADFPVSITVDTTAPGEPLQPIWRYFGADEPNYACMKNGTKLIGELGAMAPGQVYFRAHNLLTSGDGTAALKWGSTGAYAEDQTGSPVYNWDILDQIFDAYLHHGVKPYAQIGFMPKALSIKPEPYQHHWTPAAAYNEIYTGWAYPPKDFGRWGELAFQWASHCVERYGAAEVASWYWEVWNEPNIGYWRGTSAEFHELHDFAVAGVCRAVPSARVGGPDVAGSGGKFLKDFLEHCLHGTNYATGKIGTPLDFVSFHAKGAPFTTNGHVVMGIAAQLRTIEEGFRMISTYPELKGKPVVIGECDPEGCAACQGPSLAYRNGTMYSSYTAACFARIHDLAAKHKVNLVAALTWAFEFEDQPYFAGFRSLASNGIDKPVLNVFRMFSKMSGRRLAVHSDHAVPLEVMARQGVREKADVSALAAGDETKSAVLLWHYHDEDLPGESAEVSIALKTPFPDGKAVVRRYLIDEDHSNAFSVWKRMGSPQNPTPQQYAALEEAGQLAQAHPAQELSFSQGELNLQTKLARQAVELVTIDWSKASK